MTFEDKIADPFVFAILPSKTAKATIKDRWDLDHFPRERPLSGFPKDVYTLVTDAPEFAKQVWDEPLVRKFITNALLPDEKGHTPIVLDELIITDLPKTQPDTLDGLKNIPRTLTLTFRLPDVANADDATKTLMNDVIEFLLVLVDCVGQFGVFSVDVKQVSKSVVSSYTHHILFLSKHKNRLKRKC